MPGKIAKQMILLGMLVLLLSSVGMASAFADEGTCGEHLKWVLDNGALTISGTGEMYHYRAYDNSTTAPWGNAVTSVTIEQGVTTIGNYAFRFCKDLRTVDIADTVSSIGDAAFSRTGLTSVTIPGNVESIGKLAFYSCNSLETVSISEGVKSIGKRAFLQCGQLSHVMIPESLITFESNVFEQCGKLRTAGPFDSGANIEFGWETEIPDNAFNYCQSLTEVMIPEGIETIGDSAFSVTGLESVSLPDSVSSIQPWAFSACGNMLTASLSSYLLEIGYNAFSHCSRLTEILIPDSVLSIGEGAFASCENLSDVILSQNFVFDSSTVFAGCPKLANDDGFVVINNGLFGYYGSAAELTIPDGVTVIGGFAGNETIATVQIPGSVRIVSANAFGMCSHLTSVYIEEGVVSIGESAFMDCGSLSSVSIPASVLEIGEFAFRSCPVDRIDVASIDLWFRLNSQRPMLLYDNIESYPQYSLYIDGTSAEEIQIPNGMRSVPGYIFCNCKNIASVTLPYTVTEIGDHAFYGCGNLAEVNLPSGVSQIGEHAFTSCGKLLDIVIPDGVTDIKYGLFMGCSGLQNIYIPASVTSIWPVAFMDCSSLQNVFYEGSEEDWNNIYISSYNESLTTASITFQYHPLLDLILPSNLTTISAEAFANTGAQRIIIPDSVDYIESRAFADSRSLEILYFEGSPFIIENDIVEGCGNVTISCLQGSSAAKWATRQGFTVVYR